MVEIVEVKTKRDIKKFVEFPNKLYKGCPYFVPFLSIDEHNKFDKNKNESYEDCIVKCVLAYKDGKLVGRLAGIIQKLHNQKTGEKRARFSRFDCIDDEEVSNAMFEHIAKWAKEQGMEVIHGPMGYNDLDREGLLIEGFDQMSTFEEQYNYPYYQKLIEKFGFEKEVDWVEYRLFAPKETNSRLEKLSQIVSKRYNLALIKPKSIKWFVENYKDQFFDVLDAAYSPLYGVVPFSDKMKDSLIAQFSLILNKDFLIGITNADGKLVGFGLVFPSLSESVNKSRGKLFPFGIFRILRQVKHPKHIDSGLIAIRPEYQNKGVSTMIVAHMLRGMVERNIEYAETNLMLEDNVRIQGQWSVFDHIQHKRRRSFVKKI